MARQTGFSSLTGGQRTGMQVNRASLSRRRVLGIFPLAAVRSAVAWVAPWAVMSARAQSAALRLGVVPNLSPRVIFAQYQPVRSYLEAELAQPVEVQTAADFKAFHARTRAGDYDLVVTAANLARLAQVDHQWVPLAMYEPPIPGVLVRAKGASPGGPAALKGKKLALANPQSLVALRGYAWLAEQGVKKDTDYTPILARNDDSLGTLIGSADTPYAIMSMGEFRAIPEATRAGLEIETEFARVPGFVLMHAPAMAPERAARVRAALLRMGDAALGKSFFEMSGVRAIRAPQAQEMEGLDPYLAATRAAMAQ